MEKELTLIEENEINEFFNEIKTLIEKAKGRVYKTVNTEMLDLYWNIGKMIIEKQEGKKRAKYGDLLIHGISKKLTENFGKGYSVQNLRRMRQLYLTYPIRSTMLSELSISHYYELIKIKEKYKRDFYMHECINANWDVRELQRQRDSLLYERLAMSKDKNKLLELSTKGNKVSSNEDIIKDPFVLEFLDIKENTNYLESDLEKNILEHLKEFLLELGKGFAFIGSQVRITIDTEHFYPDLVFYNRILNCFVIIDLKIGKVTHQDIGQMQMYVNFYDREIKRENENKTIGILLSTNKNETIVKYTLPEDNNTIYSSEFRLTIPSEEEFIRLIENEKRNNDL